MAIAFVQRASGGAANDGPFTVTIAAAGAGNLLLAFHVDGDTTDNAMPAIVTPGMTDVGTSEQYANATNDSNSKAWYFYATGGETSVVFPATGGGANCGTAGVVMEFSGVAAVADGGPFSTAITKATGTGSGHADPPSIATAAGDCVVIMGAAAHATAGVTLAAPTNYTTNAETNSGTDTISCGAGMAYRLSGYSNPENAGAFTASATAAGDSWGAVSLALKEAPAAAALNQPHFRIRTDDTQTLNADAGWAAALDADATIDAETIFRIRFEVDTAGNAGAKTFKLQYRRNGGTWTDVPVNTAVPPTSVGSTEIVLSGQFANDDATTNILSGSAATFEAGVGLEDNVTPSITLNNEHTEYEWPLRIRVMHNDGTTRGRNADGDTFEYRIVESGGTVFTGTYELPIVTLNIPNGLLGGATIETPKRLGPFKDANGNLYTVMEYGEPNVSDEIAMIKSTDGGDQWAIMDAANAPTTAQNADDLECVDMVQVGSVLHIISHRGSHVVYHTFRTSDNGSPDTWGTVAQAVSSATSPSDQDCSLVVRSDTTVVATYTTTPSGGFEQQAYRIRSSGGTWGSEINLDSTASTSFTNATAILGENNLTYIFYKDDTNSLVYYKTLTSADVLSGRTQFNETGTVPSFHAVPQACYFDDGGVETIVSFYRRGSNMWERRIFDGVLQSERQISGATIRQNAAGGQAPEAVLATFAVDIHAAFVDATDVTLLKYDVSLDGAAYGTDVTKYDGTAALGLVMGAGNVFRHSSGNGGALVMGVIVDDGGDGLTGQNKYMEWTVSETAAQQTVNYGVAVETDTALAFTPSKVASYGVAAETDSALAFTADRQHLYGIAAETDTALAFAHTKEARYGIAVETSTALAFLVDRQHLYGVAAETDSALAFAPSKLASYGIALETDSGLAFVVDRQHLYGVAVETDSGLPYEATLPGGQTASYGVALETDSGLAFVVDRLHLYGIAAETDSGLSFIATAGEQVAQYGIAVETDSGLSVVVTKLATYGLASEVDTALAFVADRLVGYGIASETDSALAFIHEKLAQYGIAIETDDALAFLATGPLPPQEVAYAIAVELDRALAFEAETAKVYEAAEPSWGNPRVLRPLRRSYFTKNSRRR